MDSKKIKKPTDASGPIDESEKEQPISVTNESRDVSQVEILAKAPGKISNLVLAIMPKEVSEKYRMMPFEKKGNVLSVALVNPQDLDALNTLRFIAKNNSLEIKYFKVSEDIFDEMFAFYSAPSEMIKEAVRGLSGDTEFLEDEENIPEKKRERETILKEAPVTKLVQVIVTHAIEGHASDIHIEPLDAQYRVRFRVDGILHVSLLLPKSIGPVVISRIKILANLKIDEKRKPQDGRFRLTHDGNDIDFRVSSLPVISGEKIVMRILDKEMGLGDLKSLGIMGSAFENLMAAIKETYGMVLLTGPTGSGKSTTLYALLKILNKEERNIITLEDPVEYNIEGLNQSQVKPEIGYTFASGLRTILRQDPNVIMVGEVRDSETAELAVHAALTGHLMFSTLHTNTATGAIPRLIDMGVEPFLLASSLRLVMAQRLTRKICENCKEERSISEKIKSSLLDEIKDLSKEELEKYEVNLEAGIKVYHGKGCEKCNNTGLLGRVAICEVVPINESIRTIISEKNGEESAIVQEKQKAKVVTMKQDGVLKIIKGMTTVEEIARVTEGGFALEELE